jgi:hypothetical protein
MADDGASGSQQKPAGAATSSDGGRADIVLGIYLLIMPLVLTALLVWCWPIQPSKVAPSVAGVTETTGPAGAGAAGTAAGGAAAAGAAAGAGATGAAGAAGGGTAGATGAAGTGAAPGAAGAADSTGATGPTGTGAAGTGAAAPTRNIETQFLVMVLLSGALGGSLFAARNFASFKGLRRYDSAWVWWYIMRAPIGMGLALFLYMVLRGGLFSVSVSSSQDVLTSANPFGFAALAALAGMFAKEASDKLEEVFTSLFRTEQKQQRASPPVIAKIVPDKKAVGDTDPKIVVSGQSFDPQAKVTVNSSPRGAQPDGNGALTVTLAAEDLAKAGTLQVVVVNPDGKGGPSKPFTLPVG